MDNRQDASDNPYAAPSVDADMAMAASPFATDLSQDEQIRHAYLSHETSVRSVIISGIGLLQIPIGTIIHAYILYLMLSRKATVVFSPKYREIIARTPHIKYKTSLAVKIILGIFLAMFVTAIVAAILGA
ncbi:MAG: hypothetical protein JXM70_30080 [Pirellulales bacterium]|nr:hypothetical protein [Pirellulales bacterium]